MKRLILILLIILSSFLVVAHQPKVADGGTIDDPIIIEDPIISKAYYGELNGEEEYYLIDSNEEVPIYLNVLIPGDVLTHTVSAELINEGVMIESLDGENSEWKVFYERYGGDYYMMGPELGKNHKSSKVYPAGKYYVRVFNENNEGKYVLAVGEIESFPVKEIVSSFFIVPWLKSNYFGDLHLTNIILVIFFFMFASFLIGLYLKDNSIVDVAWGLGFITVTLFTLVSNGNYLPLQILVSSLVLIWGLRLSAHIYLKNRGKKEDFRYANWRKKWGKQVHLRAFFQVYMLQGLCMLIILIPVIIINSYNYGELSFLSYLGLIVWLIGFYFEAIGDWQLKKHLKRSKKIMQSGLWKYTRHPNYFGEATMWWGIYLIALPISWWSIISPLFITWLLLKVSGIPMLEKKWEGNKEYEKYKKVTNAFFPKFRK